MSARAFLCAACLALLLAACDKPPAPESAGLPAAAAPSPGAIPRFATALEMFEAMNDYTPEDGTLAIESESPLKVRISPTVAGENDPRFVREDVRRAFVYAVLRIFLHTDAQTVHVVSQPVELNMIKGSPGFGSRKLLPAPRAFATVTRAQAEQAVKDALGIDLAGLLGGTIGGHYSPESWTPISERIRFNDSSRGGGPGLDWFADSLGLQWEPAGPDQQKTQRKQQKRAHD